MKYNVNWKLYECLTGNERYSFTEKDLKKLPKGELIETILEVLSQAGSTDLARENNVLDKGIEEVLNETSFIDKEVEEVLKATSFLDLDI